MPWVHFTAAFDWKPKPQVTIAYPAGFTGLVTTRCANAAESRKVAEIVPTPRKFDGKRSSNHRSRKASKEAQQNAESSQGRNQEGT